MALEADLTVLATDAAFRPMPKAYRVVVAIYDEDGREIEASEHEEVYEDDHEAHEALKWKERAARDSGKQQSR